MSVRDMSDMEISSRISELSYYMTYCGSASAEDRYREECLELADELERRERLREKSTGTNQNS